LREAGGPRKQILGIWGQMNFPPFNPKRNTFLWIRDTDIFFNELVAQCNKAISMKDSKIRKQIYFKSQFTV
jgi:hypothetical protein